MGLTHVPEQKSEDKSQVPNLLPVSISGDQDQPRPDLEPQHLRPMARVQPFTHSTRVSFAKVARGGVITSCCVDKLPEVWGHEVPCPRPHSWKEAGKTPQATRLTTAQPRLVQDAGRPGMTRTATPRPRGPTSPSPRPHPRRAPSPSSHSATQTECRTCTRMS